MCGKKVGGGGGGGNLRFGRGGGGGEEAKEAVGVNPILLRCNANKSARLSQL